MLILECLGNDKGIPELRNAIRHFVKTVTIYSTNTSGNSRLSSTTAAKYLRRFMWLGEAGTHLASLPYVVMLITQVQSARMCHARLHLSANCHLCFSIRIPSNHSVWSGKNPLSIFHKHHASTSENGTLFGCPPQKKRRKCLLEKALHLEKQRWLDIC